MPRTRPAKRGHRRGEVILCRELKTGRDRWVRIPALLGVLAVFVWTAAAFEEPDFSADLFSRDGVFLDAAEQARTVDALAALASGFPGDARVDDDLREKALAVALRIDPLHVPSRAALRGLMVGSAPPSAPEAGSLEEIAETLWSVSERLLAAPAEPEERRLAPCLLELSLLVRPDPPEDRLETFARICGDDLPAWGTAVVLNPDGQASTRRASDLHRTAGEVLRSREQARRTELAAMARPPAEAVPMVVEPTPKLPDLPESPIPSVEPVQATLATVLPVEAVGVSAMAGTLWLEIRSPERRFERNWLRERTQGTEWLPLLGDEEEMPLSGLEIPRAIADGQGWEWPAGALGVVRFLPETRPEEGVLEMKARASLPTLVLAASALGKKPINDAYALVGEIDFETSQVSLPGDAARAVEAATEVGRHYVLVPATALDPIVDHLQGGGSHGFLLGPELIAYADLDEALGRLSSPIDPSLVAASKLMGEIVAASSKMALPELVRLGSAQDRLRSILGTCPGHLSARIMLEWGTRPVSTQSRLRQFVTKLEPMVAPWEEMDPRILSVVGSVPSGMTFLKMRNEAPPEARDLLGAAEDVVEAVSAYLQFNNKETSMGVQRLREARAAIEIYRREKAKLGFGTVADGD